MIRMEARRARDASLHAAREIFDDLVGARAAEKTPRGGADLDRITRRLSDLEPRMAPFFAERFRAETEAARRQAALLLTLRAGGPEAGEILGDVVAGRRGTPEDRALVLRALPALDPAGPIPVDLALVRRAARMAASRDPVERMGAAGILGTQETLDARERLMTMAETDPDGNVRAAAIRMLGRVGDQATLLYLRAYPRDEVESDFFIQESLDAALSTLERKLG